VSDYPGIPGTVALLQQLRKTVREFTARERAWHDQIKRSATVEIQRIESAAKREAARAAELLQETLTAAESERAQCTTRFEQRADRIHKAGQQSRKRALEAVEHEEGRAKYQLQKAHLQAERQRDTESSRVTAVWEEFLGRLNESRDAFLTLEYEAHQAFAGFGTFRAWLLRTHATEGELAGDENQLLTRLEELRESLRARLDRFRRFFLAQLFRLVPIWPLLAVLILGHAAVLVVLPQLGWTVANYQQIAWSFGLSLALVLLLYWIGQRQASPVAASIASDLAHARSLFEISEQRAAHRRDMDQARAREEFATISGTLDAQWQDAVARATQAREVQPRNIDTKASRIAEKNDRMQQACLERLERTHTEKLARQQSMAEARQRESEHARTVALAKAETDAQQGWNQLSTEWNAAIAPLYRQIEQAKRSVDGLLPPWDDPSWAQWTPPTAFRNLVPFGRIEVTVEAMAGVSLAQSRLQLPGPAAFSVPLALVYPHQGSVLFETRERGREEAVVAVLNNILFRLLAVTPADKVSLTVLDPVGLGQNFAGLMHLADYEGSHLDSRIWTQTTQIEERLAELNEHMEKVIQMYLRNEYDTIADYNAQAGVIAEKYHVLIIAGFPANFSETASRRLLNIATSGARCGVYTLIHWDQRLTLPHDFVPDQLRKNSVSLVTENQQFLLASDPLPGTRLILDAPPPPDVMTPFLHRVGQSTKDRNRVEVPFDQVAPTEEQIWSGRTTEELRVPIGRSGATKLQYLALGKGTRQHALIAGKTGSGKSTLFHVLITNLALWCPPEQVEFYLVDFKKGVEFKCYANRRLPHARVVAIESDREFGLSVLQRLDVELRRRGDLFRTLGVQDLPGYQRAGGKEPLPRSLLIIDEFQEFFVEEDRISQNAAVLLDRIVRQGRAYTLARATIGQMVIRIALQCNEADAMLIMDETNTAARLLSRPGEGIYNDMAGSLEGNSPFQAVWLPDDERDQRLNAIRARADQATTLYAGPIVFEGNAPADVRENEALNQLLHASPSTPPLVPRLWLGSPNSIKGPTEAVFPRQSGSHLLVVGQRDESILAMIGIGLLSLSAQYPAHGVRLILVDALPPGSPDRERLDRCLAAARHDVTRVGPADLSALLDGLCADLGADEKSKPIPTFLFLLGLPQFKTLRQEDDFSFSLSDPQTTDRPAARLLHLIQEGPANGLHLVVTCDTYNNLSRWFGRKLLTEFEMRVLFQMSATDSASLADAPDATSLGLHRALLYHEREGRVEKFRPYAWPENDWLSQAT
jgi:DNA segregation ATPase FtsK/SpoIIIE, S-DNA-T family